MTRQAPRLIAWGGPVVAVRCAASTGMPSWLLLGAHPNPTCRLTCRGLVVPHVVRVQILLVEACLHLLGYSAVVLFLKSASASPFPKLGLQPVPDGIFPAAPLPVVL